MKDKIINAAIIQAMADVCEQRCKDKEGCVEQCTEMQNLFETLWEHPITEVELDEDIPPSRVTQWQRVNNHLIAEVELDEDITPSDPVERTESWLAMNAFVQKWKDAGEPLTKGWYETFLTHACLCFEHQGACSDGYCPMGEDDCSDLCLVFANRGHKK